MTFSSPAVADLNGDGIGDIVYGTGKDRLQPENGRYVITREPPIPGYVIAVSGATNDVLWKAAHGGDAHTTPRFLDVNRDRVLDVIMGGREGALAAYSGRDGAVIWSVQSASVATTPVPYNFFTPAIVSDADADGVQDLLVVYGGDDTRLPGEPRDPSYLALISGADGHLLAAQPTPDGKESYSAIVAYRRADGTDWFIFGTGGETHAGAAYRAPVAALLNGTFSTRVEQLGAVGEKGVIAPPTILELTNDNELDMVISAFDGRLFAVSGANGTVLWEQRAAGEESYHSAAVARISRSGRLGLLVSRGIGVFPGYTGSTHRLYDAVDGTVHYEYRDDFVPSGAPLAVELTSDGIDELCFFSMRYPRGQGGRIHILHGPSQTLLAHDVANNLATTPLIRDVRGTGSMEMIALSWSIEPGEGTPDWRDLRAQMMRLELNAPTPAVQAWVGYMGTTTDGHYRAPSASSTGRD